MGFVHHEHEPPVAHNFAIYPHNYVITGITLGQLAREHTKRPWFWVRAVLDADHRREVTSPHRLDHHLRAP